MKQATPEQKADALRAYIAAEKTRLIKAAAEESCHQDTTALIFCRRVGCMTAQCRGLCIKTVDESRITRAFERWNAARTEKKAADTISRQAWKTLTVCEPDFMWIGTDPQTAVWRIRADAIVQAVPRSFFDESP